MKRRPGNQSRIKKKLLQKHGCYCDKCGATPNQVILDHILPLIDGGTDDKTNLQFLCYECNIKKTKNEAIDRNRRRRNGI